MRSAVMYLIFKKLAREVIKFYITDQVIYFIFQSPSKLEKAQFNIVVTENKIKFNATG